MRVSLRAALLLLTLLTLLGAVTLWPRHGASSPEAGGSTLSTTLGCDRLYDGAGRALPSTCVRCAAPWLSALDGVLGRVCRCMVGPCEAASGEAEWSEEHDAEARAGRGVQLVLGLGTGRCGTVALSRLLRAQPGCAETVTHETHPVIPWTPASDSQAAQLVRARVRALLSRRATFSVEPGAPPAVPLVADVASYYLPHVRAVLALEPGAVFLVLRRPRAEVVASFLAKEKGADLWSDCANASGWSSDQRYWATAHPKLPCGAAGPDAARSLGLYWDLYAQQVELLQAAFPDRVRTFPSPRVLRDTRLQKHMLRWLGVSNPRTGKQRKANCVASCTSSDAAVRR